MTYEVLDVSLCWPSSHFCPFPLFQQELCAEAQSVSPEELGEDAGETRAAEERG